MKFEIEPPSLLLHPPWNPSERAAKRTWVTSACSTLPSWEQKCCPEVFPLAPCWFLTTFLPVLPPWLLPPQPPNLSQQLANPQLLSQFAYSWFGNNRFNFYPNGFLIFIRCFKRFAYPCWHSRPCMQWHNTYLSKLIKITVSFSVLTVR